MSTYISFSEDVPFAIQGSNVSEIVYYSSTLDDVRTRYYTNNNNTVQENTYTGVVVGSSNYDKSSAFGKNNLYIAGVDQHAITRFATFDDYQSTIHSRLNVFGDTSFGGAITVNSTSFLQLPVGTTNQRPDASNCAAGMVRYNTTNATYEGYGAGSSWGSLGGVKSVDGLTYIVPELYPTANDSNLRFFTAGQERLRISSNGYVGIGTVPQYQLHVSGGQILLQSDTSITGSVLISNVLTCSNLNVIGSFTTISMCNVTSNTERMVIQNVGTGPALTVTQLGTTPDTPCAEFWDNENGIGLKVDHNGNVGIKTTSIREGFNLDVRGSATVSNDLDVNRIIVNVATTHNPSCNIDFDAKTLSNVDQILLNSLSTGKIITTELVVNTITPMSPGGTINFSGATLSNVKNVINTLWTNSISVNPSNPGGSNIDFNQTNASNLYSVYTENVFAKNIISTQSNNELYFNNARILDVDSITVRSNITVTIQSDATYTNLPSDVVRLTNGKINEAFLPTSLVRTNTNNVIDPSLLPTIDGDKKMFMHTNDRVGIGLKKPLQKLHVFGNQCIEGGYLVIGDTVPLARCHIVDDNAATSLKIEQRGTMPILDIQGSNAFPVMYINGNANVGIHTSAPNTNYALDINGDERIQGKLTCKSINSETGTVQFDNCELSNIWRMDTSDLTINGKLQVNLLAATANQNNIQMNNALHITGYDQSLATTPEYSLIGLKVDYDALATSYLTKSDIRLKENIQDADATAALQHILNLQVKRYQFKRQPLQPLQWGFIAQDVETVLPSLVKTINDTTVPDLKLLDLTQLIPLLCSSIQRLHEIVSDQQRQLRQLRQLRQIDELCNSSSI